MDSEKQNNDAVEPELDRETENNELIRKTRIRLAIVVFGVLGVFLFSSEFMNAIFNNRLDAMRTDFLERVRFAFKPTVVFIYLVFSALLYVVILRYLAPLFSYLRDGENYDKARKAAISVPWVIILFQLTAWTIGTTLYYYLKDWNAASGIPFLFGLLLKIAVGLPSGVYISIIFNMILIPSKRKLNIVTIREGENDTFSRNRDYYVVLAILVFLVVNFTYLTYYFARSLTEVTFGAFYLPLLLTSIFYVLVSYGLIALSKKEYFLQIESIKEVLRQMAGGSTKLDRRIPIINYNELGETAGYVNTILNNFSELIRKVSETSSTMAETSSSLLSTSKQNAAHSNQQASSAAEIVSTMEEVDKLSKDLGEKASNVEDSAGRMKESVNDGFSITQENTEKMKQVRESYEETINGMKNLGEHISGIWEIVKIINGIAGQIKIIAFNAALEASSAGEAGKNFEIVASEIRRLADSTVNSTNEIRTKIGDIQHASDELIGSSEEDTIKIQDAWQLSQRLDEVFKKILELSDSSLKAAESMSQSVSQQINSFEQVLITARQISDGINDFTASVEETNRIADNIEQGVETLNSIVESSADEEAQRGDDTPQSKSDEQKEEER